MKVGVYLEGYEVGGAESHLVSLIRGWPNRNDKFILFTNRRESFRKLFEASFLELGVEIIYFRSFSYFSFVSQIMKLPMGAFLRYFAYPFLPIFFFLQYAQALRLLKNNRADVLLADNGAYPGAWGVLASVLAAKTLNTKGLLLVHHSSSRSQLLRHGFENWLDRKISTSTQIVTVSQASKNSLLEQRPQILEGKPVAVIYNGTDLNLKYPASSVMQKFRGRHASQQIVGIVGRIEAYKGHEELIRALALLDKTEQERLEVVFIGSSLAEEKQRLNQIAISLGVERKIHFLGYLEGHAQSFIRSLDLLAVLTRDFEGFGLTLIEAMTVGVPVLATTVGAIPEFVIHLENGYLVPPLNPSAVSGALKSFVNDLESWKARANFAKGSVQQFSEIEMAKNYERLIRNILSS